MGPLLKIFIAIFIASVIIAIIKIIYFVIVVRKAINTIKEPIIAPTGKFISYY